MLSETTAGGVLVKLHGAAWAMDDQHAAFSKFSDKIIHARRHFGDASGGAFAPMLIPHIAYDGGGFRSLPVLMRLSELPLLRVGWINNEPARIQVERFGEGALAGERE